MSRYALCNELFGDLSFADTCSLAAQHDFHGLELAPFTLGDDPRRIDSADVFALRRTLEKSGLACAGLHWLLASPAGLHITTPDTDLRRTSWEVLEHLAWLCAELGGQVMVLGSPRERSAPDIPVDEARARLIDGLRDLAPSLERSGVKLLLEALGTRTTNLVNTLAEARAVIDQVESPWVRGMFDFHNVAEETANWATLISQHAAYIEHIHINSPDGSYLRQSTSDYEEAFRTLGQIGYDGWISLEIFNFDEGPEHVLPRTRAALRIMEKNAGS